MAAPYVVPDGLKYMYPPGHVDASSMVTAQRNAATKGVEQLEATISFLENDFPALSTHLIELSEQSDVIASKYLARFELAIKRLGSITSVELES